MMILLNRNGLRATATITTTTIITTNNIIMCRIFFSGWWKLAIRFLSSLFFVVAGGIFHFMVMDILNYINISAGIHEWWTNNLIQIKIVVFSFCFFGHIFFSNSIYPLEFCSEYLRLKGEMINFFHHHHHHKNWFRVCVRVVHTIFFNI